MMVKAVVTITLADRDGGGQGPRVISSHDFFGLLGRVA